MLLKAKALPISMTKESEAQRGWVTSNLAQVNSDNKDESIFV